MAQATVRVCCDHCKTKILVVADPDGPSATWIMQMLFQEGWRFPEVSVLCPIHALNEDKKEL